jgi:hypothetical protein
MIDICANGKKGKVFFFRYGGSRIIVLYKEQLTAAFDVQAAERSV